MAKSARLERLFQWLEKHSFSGDQTLGLDLLDAVADFLVLPHSGSLEQVQNLLQEFAESEFED